MGILSPPLCRSILTAIILLAGVVGALADTGESGNGPQAEIAFQAGLAAKRAGDHERAIRNYRVAIELVPAPRIKLELAYSLLQTREYGEARKLFKEVYTDSRTPLTVKRNIRPLMEEAELHLLRVRYGVRITSNSNPERVGDGATLYFNGIPMTYQPSQEKRTAYGLQPWLSVEKLWNNGYITALNLNARLFEDSVSNSGAFTVAVGKRYERLGGLYVQARLDGDNQEGGSYVMPSIDAWKRTELNKRWHVGLGAQIGYMFAENEDISGGYYRPYVFGDRNVTNNIIAFGRTSIEYLNSRNDYYSYLRPRLEIGLAIQRGDWKFSPRLDVSYRAFAEHDPFWGTTRHDVIYRPALSFSNDRFEFRGMKPEINFFYERIDSNIAINSYDQFGGFVNISRAF